MLFENKSVITATYLQGVMCLEGLLAGKQDKGVRSGKQMSRLPDCSKIIGNVTYYNDSFLKREVGE